MVILPETVSSRAVARLLEEEARTTDFVARFGGEEFAVIFPNTSVDAAHVIAERFRKALSAHAWEHRDVTVSIGVAEWSPDIAEPEALISLADKALYRAKQEGRNMVVAVHPVHEDRAGRRSKITLLPATGPGRSNPRRCDRPYRRAGRTGDRLRHRRYGCATAAGRTRGT